MRLRDVTAAAAAFLLVLGFAGCSGNGSPSASGTQDLVRVPADAGTLTDAAARVAPGGTIVIAPGVYDEQLQISTPDVTVRGEDRNRTVIDGGGIRPYGVVVIADGVTVENLTVTGATFYGVLFTGLHDQNGPSAPTADGYVAWDPEEFPPLQRFLVDHVTAYNNGLYGIYSFNSQHGVIRDSYASGSADSGIYVGQCENCDVLVTGNIAERNAVGFENANASDSVVIAGNRFSGNRVGMTLLSSYQEAFTPQRGNTVVGNLISDNVEAESPAQADGAFATGVGISGGVGNVFTDNRISGNTRAGVILANTEDLPAASNAFEGTAFEGNGVDVANASAPRTPATGNCVSGTPTSFPVDLAAQLAAACAGAADAQSAGEPSGPAAPPGLSFKRVPAPRDQPDLPERADRSPLPAVVAMPAPGTFAVPDASFLADLAGTR